MEDVSGFSSSQLASHPNQIIITYVHRSDCAYNQYNVIFLYISLLLKRVCLCEKIYVMLLLYQSMLFLVIKETFVDPEMVFE